MVGGDGGECEGEGEDGGSNKTCTSQQFKNKKWSPWRTNSKRFVHKCFKIETNK